MGLFFRRKSPQPILSPFEQQFWDKYWESLQLKDQCALFSAYRARAEATNMALMKVPRDIGYAGMGYHNMAILSMYHTGDGKAAGHFARKSLDCGLEYRRLSEQRKDILQFGAHLESIQVAALTATDYEESVSYLEEGKRLYGGVFIDMLEALEEFRPSNPRYGDYQRAVSLTYYSRVSAELDKGDYAPAISLMDIMLHHAEEPQYDFSYEEYVDILDDYATLTIMMLLRKGDALSRSGGDFSHELAWIADKPLKLLAEFMPDCQPSDREKFEAIIEAFRRLPGVSGRDSFEAFR